MPKSKQQKEHDLAELQDRLEKAKGTVLAEYRGTSVKDMDKCRRVLEKQQVNAKVYKVTLLRRALTALGIDAASVDYKTPVILATSTEEETLPAKLIKDISKDIKTVGVLSGIMEKHMLSRQEVLVLADLPSKQELRGSLVRTINAPASGFVNVLAGNVRSLLNVLKTIAQK